ncbi:MAG TPA: hypothetical protein VFV50_08020, partial [Bdellovibrionales bacterium]|nr:hypothetical protein [Bdellovibrionales bacterium]
MTSNELAVVVDDVQKEFAQNAYVDLATLQDENETSSHVETILERRTQALSAEAKKRLYDEYFGMGPLEELVNDAEITEIAVNGAGSIWFEKGGSLYRHPDGFLSGLTYQNAVRRL